MVDRTPAELASDILGLGVDAASLASMILDPSLTAVALGIVQALQQISPQVGQLASAPPTSPLPVAAPQPPFAPDPPPPVPPPPPPPPAGIRILDFVPGVVAAFGLRQLSSTYSGFAIQVRRSSDNATLNIGLNADGTLDTATALLFQGAGSLFIIKWYDQSGHGRDAAQATVAQQPQLIINNAATNKYPAIQFTHASNTKLSTPSFSQLYDVAVSVSYGYALIDTSGGVIWGHSDSSFTNGSGGPEIYVDVGGGVAFFNAGGGTPSTTGTIGIPSGLLPGLFNTNVQADFAVQGLPNLYWNNRVRGSLVQLQQGNTDPNQDSGSQVVTIGGDNQTANPGGYFHQGRTSEIIMLPGDQTLLANAVDINTKNYYVLGAGNTPILDQLGVPAACAYSLRKLRAAYAGSAVLVRRVSDSVTQNIGFDVNGNFDVATATTFQGASSLTVATWYDQSGNGHDCTQATAASQPPLLLNDAVMGGKSTVNFHNHYLQSASFVQNWNHAIAFLGVVAPDKQSFVDGIVACHGAQFSLGVSFKFVQSNGDYFSNNGVMTCNYDGGGDGMVKDSFMADGAMHRSFACQGTVNNVYFEDGSLNATRILQGGNSPPGQFINVPITIGDDVPTGTDGPISAYIMELIVWSGDKTANASMVNNDLANVLGVPAPPSVAPQSVQWNPAQTNGVAVSGSGLTASGTFDGTHTAPESILANQPIVPGNKNYWELHVDKRPSAGTVTIGLGFANSWQTGQLIGHFTGGGVGVDDTGAVYVSGNLVGNVGVLSQGDLVCVAYDDSKKRFWVRRGPTGNWNGSATGQDPGSGTGGFDTSVLGSNVPSPAVSLAALPASSNSQVTANFGASAFTGATPSGFSPFAS